VDRPQPDAEHDPGAERRAGLAAGPEPPRGPERLRQEAFETAWRFLAHRERTEAELQARLERNDVEPELIAEVLDELREGGYVDDAGFARRFAEDRRNLDGWGADRIEQRLRTLGIERHHIQAALAHDDGHDELAAATALLQRRYPTPPETPQQLERALGFLVRKGYELELAHDALRRHGALALDE
jgi:regulatory protein